jgi:PEP-CTERM motif-containing protein
MKRFVLASAVLVAAIGTASAATINSDTVTIWSAATPGATSTSASQQGLPTATGLFGGPLPLVAASTPFTSPINYNDTALNTIGGFFASDSPAAPTPATCNATCSALPLSLGNFADATVFRFTFTALTPELLTINHDDGVSLFLAGTENLTNSNNLLPLSASSPTTASISTVFIQPGVYDLWYAEVNGLPAVLQASAVPEPSTWAMMLLGFAGLGFAFRQSRRKVSFA